ncbi:hypothetical protein CBER1_08296 [Cercospora berteroae]|uniref:Uncharacterized protein n=1 Tax=Cercospora berteroae TaxID=357750 RepID=A0A2S6C7M3_9PEZI|nr:hypothetical protein CBER1_08296 [Cercospora berteroae]
MADQANLHYNYWKVPSDSHLSVDQVKDVLNEPEAQIVSDPSDHQIRKYFSRSKLGLLEYAHCSDDELRSFIGARGLEMPKNVSGAKEHAREDLTEAPERADDQQNLTTFFLLPGELRNHIYALYFADFKRPLYAPIQPAIACASKQLRAETLKLFYSECTFRLLLWLGCPARDSLPCSMLAMGPQMETYFARTSPELIGCITKLQVVVTDWNTKNIDAANQKSCLIPPICIKFSQKGTDCSVDFAPDGATEQDTVIHLHSSQLDALRGVGEICQKIMDREGKYNLVVQDMNKIGYAIWKSLHYARESSFDEYARSCARAEAAKRRTIRRALRAPRNMDTEST